jgi:quercetin dioxygenase-like cupin family protein
LSVTLAATSAAARQAQPLIYPGGCVTPVSERTVDAGCYLLAEVPVQESSEKRFWHLYTYPTMPAAAAARSPSGAAVQSLGKFWVFTIADEGWRPASGTRVSVVGPLEVDRGTRYNARYMESIMPPAVRAGVGNGHNHPGPEAFYIVSGAPCLESPASTIVTRAGESVIMPAGPPMTLSGVGTENRTAVLLVLHDTTQPWISREVPAWTRPGRCPQ